MGKDNKKTGDMSVEDILKSIRGIIDNHNKPNVGDEDVLELTNIVKEGKKNPEVENEREELKDPLLSEQPAIETANLLKELAEKASTAAKEGRRPKALTMEDLVIEMMRPQLSRWLNENLPALVKQLVEKEIKRLMPDDEDRILK